MCVCVCVCVLVCVCGCVGVGVCVCVCVHMCVYVCQTCETGTGTAIIRSHFSHHHTLRSTRSHISTTLSYLDQLFEVSPCSLNLLEGALQDHFAGGGSSYGNNITARYNTCLH